MCPRTLPFPNGADGLPMRKSGGIGGRTDPSGATSQQPSLPELLYLPYLSARKLLGGLEWELSVFSLKFTFFKAASSPQTRPSAEFSLICQKNEKHEGHVMQAYVQMQTEHARGSPRTSPWLSCSHVLGMSLVPGRRSLDPVKGNQPLISVTAALLWC